MESIRRLALHDTELAHAQVGTLRLKLSMANNFDPLLANKIDPPGA
jgi:hypothetical protein